MAIVTFGLEYVVDPNQPEKKAQFIAAVQSALPALKEMPGHVETRLFQEVGNPDKYLIFSVWENGESFRTFMKSDLFAGATKLGRDILMERPRHYIYNERQ